MGGYIYEEVDIDPYFYWKENLEKKGYLKKMNTRFIDPRYKIWRNKVIDNQHGRCGKCGDKATHAHHIQNYKNNISLRYEVSNGILMCKECHEQFHDTYGTYNNGMEQIQTFLDISRVRCLYI